MDFMKGERKVALSGEAYFEVKKHPGKKFIVNTSDISVRVLGTKFNIKAYPDEETIKTTLVEGSVSILNLKGSKKNKETYLTPNQTAIYYKQETKEEKRAETRDNEPMPGAAPNSVQIENQINTILYTSWKDEDWVIEGLYLGDLARELERRYNVIIRFEDESIKKYRFNGIIANENIEQILEIIKVSAPVRYTISNNQIRLNYNKTSKSIYDEFLNR
jgi:ferric-dicitrate binding protein FerR (iron transport regulator)